MQILIIAGDVFEKLSERDDQGWCRGRKDGRTGLYPESYAHVATTDWNNARLDFSQRPRLWSDLESHDFRFLHQLSKDLSRQVLRLWRLRLSALETVVCAVRFFQSDLVLVMDNSVIHSGPRCIHGLYSQNHRNHGKKLCRCLNQSEFG